MRNGLPSSTDLFAMDANETSTFVGGSIFQGQFGVYRMTNNDDSWMAANEGLPMFQNRALIIQDDVLFGSFVGDKAVWSRPVQNVTTGIVSFHGKKSSSTCHDIGIKAYPNPADGSLHIDAEDHTFGLKEIIISDISGKPLYHTEGTANTTLDISNYVAGMYIVNVTSAQRTCYTKFVKQ
jgi:hypothetical protein